MEHNKYFIGLVDIIAKLEHQLEESMKTKEQITQEIEHQIEEQFAQCINALATRKASLLQDVKQKVDNQNKQSEATRKRLYESIDGSKKILETGKTIYKLDVATAENIWKGMESIPIPQAGVFQIRIEFSKEFLKRIQSFGTVQDAGSFSKAVMVSTVAGSKQGYTGGLFDHLGGLLLNPRDGCLYVSDYGNKAIRKVTLQGEVTTFASTPSTPYGIVMNHKENTFFIASPTAHTISKVTSSGAVSVLAGGVAGYKDGIGANAMFNNPTLVTIDQRTGTLFVGEAKTDAVRKITPQGEVSTLAGGKETGYVDGKGEDARFKVISGLCYDEVDECLLVCDYGNNKLRRVALNGEVTTLCNVPDPNFVVVTTNRTILVSSFNRKVIYKVTNQDGTYKAEILVGGSPREPRDGEASECGFVAPVGMALHELSHSCYVSDSYCIRKITFAN